MAKVTIPWGDGSGDNFYIDYTGVEEWFDGSFTKTICGLPILTKQE